MALFHTSLLNKLKKDHSDKAGHFVECLSSMGVEGPVSNFYDYTKTWIELVDRGSLFHVNENSYLFFRSLELQTRIMLPHFLKNQSKSKDLFIQELIDEEDVQFFWSIIFPTLMMPLNFLKWWLNYGSQFGDFL